MNKSLSKFFLRKLGKGKRTQVFFFFLVLHISDIIKGLTLEISNKDTYVYEINHKYRRIELKN